jgi:hypothetical protein
MIYLSGCSSPRYEQAIIDMGVGLLIQPGSYRPERVTPFPYWAADNGCASVIDGQVVPNPDWTLGKWLRMVAGIMDLPDEVRKRCLYLLVPDVPCDHMRTLERFYVYKAWANLTGLPVAFAVQDGATERSIPWEYIDVAFLAGTTEWKMSREAFNFACSARDRTLWIHMGRVNSWERLDWASTIGADSSDGTFMRHGKPEDMVARMKVWLDNNNPRLFQKQAAVG